MNDQKLKEIMKSDAVILEPTALSEQSVKVLKDNGVKIFGYVSLMQLENWNEELKEHVVDTDYVKVNGEKIYIKEWDTYVMDVRERHYRDALLWKIETYVTGQQLDGVFFDTVDDLDYYFNHHKEVQQQMRRGYQSLLKDIKQRYPDLLVIQNRGFETYQASSRLKIDGLLWEGFKVEDLKDSEWAKKWLQYFKKEQLFGRVRVFTVVPDKESQVWSVKNKFPAFVRTNNTYQE